MSFDFPASPVIDTVFTDTASGKSYTYDGEKWQAQGGSSSSSATGVSYVFDGEKWKAKDGSTTTRRPDNVLPEARSAHGL